MPWQNLVPKPEKPSPINWGTPKPTGPTKPPEKTSLPTWGDERVKRPYKDGKPVYDSPSVTPIDWTKKVPGLKIPGTGVTNKSVNSSPYAQQDDDLEEEYKKLWASTTSPIGNEAYNARIQIDNLLYGANRYGVDPKQYFKDTYMPKVPAATGDALAGTNYAGMNKDDAMALMRAQVTDSADKDFAALYGDSKNFNKTPTAYVDTYGYEHATGDESDAMRTALRAEYLRQAGLDVAQNAGQGYDLTGMDNRWMKPSGGYLADNAGNRLRIGLPGAIEYGNAAEAGGGALVTPKDEYGTDLALRPLDMRQALDQAYAIRQREAGQPVTASAGQGDVLSAYDYAPQNAYQARIQNPDGTAGTGYIVNNQTYYDPMGTQRIAPGTTVTDRSGRQWTMPQDENVFAPPSSYAEPQGSGLDFSSMLASMFMSGGAQMPDASQFQPKTYDEYLDIVSEKLEPRFDTALKQRLAAVDTDSAQRGFFGQTPWAGQRQETAALVEAEKADMVAQMAQNLWGMDTQQAQQALQNAWQAYQAQQQQQQTMYEMWQAAQAAQAQMAQNARDEERWQAEQDLAWYNAQTNRDYKTDYLNDYLMGNQKINQQKADYTTNKPYYKPTSKKVPTTTPKNKYALLIQGLEAFKNKFSNQ